MPAMPSGSPACPDADRPRRLADMIPGEATSRVGLTGQAWAWPHPHATVTDTASERIEVGRTTVRIANGWILRVRLDADWTSPHTFDLATATLTRSGLVAAGRGR